MLPRVMPARASISGGPCRKASVIPAEPAEERPRAVGAGWVGERIVPGAQEDLDEAFRLAVGAGRVGPGPQVPQAARGAVPAPRSGAIGRPVVRHHGLHGDALGAEPRQRALQEGEGVAPPVRGPHLGVGQPGVVVAGDLHMRPARARAAVDAVRPDARADVPAAAQLPGVQVEQLLRLGAFVAHGGRPRSPRAARVPPPPQHLPHRQGRAPQQRPKGDRAGPAALARRQDLRFRLEAQAPRLPPGGRRAFLESGPPLRLVARLPAEAGRAARPNRPGRGPRAQAGQHRGHRAEPRLKRIAQALRRRRSITHRDLPRDLGYVETPVSPEVPLLSGASQVCSQYTQDKRWKPQYRRHPRQAWPPQACLKSRTIQRLAFVAKTQKKSATVINRREVVSSFVG